MNDPVPKRAHQILITVSFFLLSVVISDVMFAGMPAIFNAISREMRLLAAVYTLLYWALFTGLFWLLNKAIPRSKDVIVKATSSAFFLRLFFDGILWAGIVFHGSYRSTLFSFSYIIVKFFSQALLLIIVSRYLSLSVGKRKRWHMLNSLQKKKAILFWTLWGLAALAYLGVCLHGTLQVPEELIAQPFLLLVFVYESIVHSRATIAAQMLLFPSLVLWFNNLPYKSAEDIALEEQAALIKQAEEDAEDDEA